ncbi:MAG: CheR family methyltransferase, partial [Ferruginibacter sp.]
MKVETNEVYLIPNDKYLTIKNNRFHLTDKQFVKGPHLTVNEFFNSLALNSGKQAIGIIFSGLGSDGTEGVKAIKNAGGMVIARNPDTAEFGSMPANAIATGLVDYVLEPSAIPTIISSYLLQQENNLENTKEDEKNLAIILDLLKVKSPLDFTEYRHSTILRRIKRRAAENNFTNLTAYIELLKTKSEEVEALMQDFLISVTSFFRGKDPFDYLENEIIPALLKRLEPNEEIKIWVAGCATGEEAYSFAILLAEQLTGDLKNRVVKIFATDIDSPALAFAGKGVYPDSIEKDVTSIRLQKYFVKVANFYTIKPEIRKMVIFAQHDIVKNPPYLNMLLISCRNLLIYMTPTLQKKVYLTLLFGLKKDAYLFLGSSENPVPILSSLEVVSNQWKIYRNLETKRPFRFDAFTLPVLTNKKIEQVTHHYTAADEYNNLSDVVNNLQATAHNQLIVCIDSNNQVIKSFGDTSRYLLQKHFTSNLADLLPKPMAVAFNIVAANVLKKGEKQTVQDIKIKKGDTVVKVSLTVTPIQIKKGMPQLLMVTFSEDAPGNNEENDALLFDEKLYINQYTHNIEEELNELKNKLQGAYTQLDAGNENMQSFNEELLSANEEMQSTNEELQSVNEELHTVNADYQLKNKELLEMNDDLNNYFRSNINGQLFVNKELQLMKFSPGTVKQINLVPTDIGRPLSNITTNIKFETIIDDIKQVISGGNIIT